MYSWYRGCATTSSLSNTQLSAHLGDLFQSIARHVARLKTCRPLFITMQQVQFKGGGGGACAGQMECLAVSTAVAAIAYVISLAPATFVGYDITFPLTQPLCHKSLLFGCCLVATPTVTHGLPGRPNKEWACCVFKYTWLMSLQIWEGEKNPVDLQRLRASGCLIIQLNARCHQGIGGTLIGRFYLWPLISALWRKYFKAAQQLFSNVKHNNRNKQTRQNNQ